MIDDDALEYRVASSEFLLVMPSESRACKVAAARVLRLNTCARLLTDILGKHMVETSCPSVVHSSYYLRANDKYHTMETL